MESANAKFLRQGLLDTYRKMTPAERIRVFIEHSERMKRLRDAGLARLKALEQREGPSPRSPEDLIALKIFAGSPKDIDDAGGLLEN